MKGVATVNGRASPRRGLYSPAANPISDTTPTAPLLEVVPISFRAASEFVAKYHRHNKPPRGCKFCVAVQDDHNNVRGVAQCGRPVARAFDDGRTLEINRTCTDGVMNGNSKLYGACRQIAKGMGYKRIITYTQADESGASLRASGFVRVKELPARGSWAECSSEKWNTEAKRQAGYAGNVARVLWEVRFS